jgi:hypothetical protein
MARDNVARQLSLMLSRGADPAQAAAWIEGFLSASGLVLLHHEELLAVIDEWLSTISKDVFDEQVPILRRTFAAFARAERRQIGERVKVGAADMAQARAASVPQEIDPLRAARVLPLLRTLFATSAKGIKR